MQLSESVLFLFQFYLLLYQTAEHAHSVVIRESRRGLLDSGGGGHALLFDRDPHRVPEAGPHQLLQLLRLRG